MCLVLTDQHGRIIERLVGDGALRSQLDGIVLAPGFRYEEGHVGTNAISPLSRACSTSRPSMHVADRRRATPDLLAPTLLMMTVATGLVDAVSFLGLRRPMARGTAPGPKV